MVDGGEVCVPHQHDGCWNCVRKRGGCRNTAQAASTYMQSMHAVCGCTMHTTQHCEQASSACASEQAGMAEAVLC